MGQGRDRVPDPIICGSSRQFTSTAMSQNQTATDDRLDHSQEFRAITLDHHHVGLEPL
jgi:hypothetical protein